MNTRGQAFFMKLAPLFNMFKRWWEGPGRSLTTPLHLNLKNYISSPTWPDVQCIFRPDIIYSVNTIGVNWSNIFLILGLRRKR